MKAHRGAPIATTSPVPVSLQRLSSNAPAPAPQQRSESRSPIGRDFSSVPLNAGPSASDPAQALRRSMQGTRGDLPHRSAIEGATGRSFANVRSYSGPPAVEACASVGARAFTVQNVVAFAEPSPPLHVAMHEAMHVLQQRGDVNPMHTPPSSLRASQHHDATEHEAERLASAAVRDGERPEPAEHSGTQLNGFFWLSGCDGNGCDSKKPPPRDAEAEGDKPAPQPAGELSVKDVDKNGWLNVKGVDSPLPFALKVTLKQRKNERDEFEVLEGRFKGKQASVKQKSATESYLGLVPHDKSAKVTLNKTTEKLTYGSTTDIDAFTDPQNPLPDGDHEIQIPDEPHHIADKYLTDSPFATTWFRLGSSGDRYLHPGLISAGCATVRDTKSWTAIYQYLIARRKSDTAVGTISVKS